MTTKQRKKKVKEANKAADKAIVYSGLFVDHWCSSFEL